MTAQTQSDLHGVGNKLNTTQPKKFYNIIKTQIMPEILTEYSRCQELLSILLGLRSYGKYIHNLIYPPTLLMAKYYACINLSRN